MRPKKRILLIGLDPWASEMTFVLETWGYKVIVCRDREMLCELAESDRPFDAVLAAAPVDLSDDYRFRKDNVVLAAKDASRETVREALRAAVSKKRGPVVAERRPGVLLLVTKAGVDRGQLNAEAA